MAESTDISWCDSTWNPWIGCTKVSPACANCYAERDFDHRYRAVNWGPRGQRKKTSRATWASPVAWNQAISEGKCSACKGVGSRKKKNGLRALCMVCNGTGEPYRRPRVFCASLADVFEDWKGLILDAKGRQLVYCKCIGDVNIDAGETIDGRCECCGVDFRPLTMDDLRAKLFRLIKDTPNLDWLVLTKRPENIRPMMPNSEYRQNLWLGTSVENQEWANKRVPELILSRDLASVLFLSCEPIVGPIDLTYLRQNHYEHIDCLNGHHVGHSFQLAHPTVDWVIAGGESGPKARPADPKWFRELRNQCQFSKTPFHFKQWGEFNEHQEHVGTKKAGRELDGELHDAFPAPRTRN